MKRLLVVLVVVFLLSGSSAVGAVGASSLRFVGTRTTKKLHDSNHAACRRYIKQTKKSNRVYFKSKKAGRKAGYVPCKKC